MRCSFTGCLLGASGAKPRPNGLLPPPFVSLPRPGVPDDDDAGAGGSLLLLPNPIDVPHSFASSSCVSRSRSIRKGWARALDKVRLVTPNGPKTILQPSSPIAQVFGCRPSQGVGTAQAHQYKGCPELSCLLGRMRDSCSPCAGTAKPSRQRRPQFPRGEGGSGGDLDEAPARQTDPGHSAHVSPRRRGRPSRWQSCVLLRVGLALHAPTAANEKVKFISGLMWTPSGHHRAVSMPAALQRAGLRWDPGNRSDPGCVWWLLCVRRRRGPLDRVARSCRDSVGGIETAQRMAGLATPYHAHSHSLRRAAGKSRYCGGFAPRRLSIANLGGECG
jgi:hypothetical protein